MPSLPPAGVAVGCSSARSLKLARKLLAAPDLDVELVLPYLLDALRDADLATRQTASALLVELGPVVVPALLDVWDEPDAELRQALIVTLGRIGPAAVRAVPLLRRVPETHFLAPYAKQALALIHPPVLRDVLAALQSPWTWSRLIDWLLFVVTHPVTAVISFISTFLSVVHWHRALAGAHGQIAPAVQASFALLGIYCGGTLGANLGGWSTAKSASKLGGLCGASAGLLVGGLAAALVEPLAAALRGG